MACARRPRLSLQNCTQAVANAGPKARCRRRGKKPKTRNTCCGFGKAAGRHSRRRRVANVQCAPLMGKLTRGRVRSVGLPSFAQRSTYVKYVFQRVNYFLLQIAEKGGVRGLSSKVRGLFLGIRGLFPRCRLPKQVSFVRDSKGCLSRLELMDDTLSSYGWAGQLWPCPL